MKEEYYNERIKYNFLYHNTVKNGLLYKYCSFETLNLILKNSTLYYSTANEFNDPFELSTNIFEEYNDKYCLENVLKIDYSQIDYSDLNGFKLFKIFTNVWEELKNEIGITCFSKSPLNSLMWSHYADKHKGVCIGFNFDIEEQKDKIIQMPVRYIEKIEPINFWQKFEKGFDDLVAFHWLLTKSKIWEYEQEVRRIYINRKGILPFNLNTIFEIYLGINTDLAEIEKLNQVLLEINLTKIKVIQTKIIPSTFSIGI